MNNENLSNEAAYYWSVCILRRLCDMGMITEAEYEKIRAMNAEYYGTKIHVS